MTMQESALAEASPVMVTVKPKTSRRKKEAPMPAIFPDFDFTLTRARARELGLDRPRNNGP